MAGVFGSQRPAGRPACGGISSPPLRSVGQPGAQEYLQPRGVSGRHLPGIVERTGRKLAQDGPYLARPRIACDRDRGSTALAHLDHAGRPGQREGSPVAPPTPAAREPHTRTPRFRRRRPPGAGRSGWRTARSRPRASQPTGTAQDCSAGMAPLRLRRRDRGGAPRRPRSSRTRGVPAPGPPELPSCQRS